MSNCSRLYVNEPRLLLLDSLSVTTWLYQDESLFVAKESSSKVYYREGKFWPIWAILSRTDEIFGDKYKVWLICLWELRALEHVESTRMQVGWWVGQRMKPSVDGRRGDRSGWKLVGNSSKWERPVGETTQDGARISHYRQNQNNPTLTKSRQTRAPFLRLHERCWEL